MKNTKKKVEIPNKRVDMAGELSKYMLDISKAMFTGLVLGSVIRGDFPQSVIMFWGIIGTALFLLTGIAIMSFSRR